MQTPDRTKLHLAWLRRAVGTGLVGTGLVGTGLVGTGLVGDDYYQSLKQTGFTAPVSLHVPYLQPKTKAEALAGIEQIKKDFACLKKQLQ